MKEGKSLKDWEDTADVCIYLYIYTHTHKLVEKLEIEDIRYYFGNA